MTAPLKRENLSCLQASSKGHPYPRAEPQLFALLHWCCDDRPHGGTALYTEWISALLPIQSQPSNDPSYPPERMHNMPYIAFT